MVITDLSTLRPGEKVICYQPPPIGLTVRGDPLKVTLKQCGRFGWWYGYIHSLEADENTGQSLAVVGPKETGGPTLEYDGEFFPIFSMQHLPEEVKEFLESPEVGLAPFLEEASSRTLQEEFFEDL